MQNNTPVVGKAGISAQVVLHSISEQGVNLYTLLIDFPRIVLAELAKHRMLSMSAASSRAIPFAKMQEQLSGRPVRFGASNAGMQDAGEYKEVVLMDSFEECNTSVPRFWSRIERTTNKFEPDEAWEVAKERAVEMSTAFAAAGYAKQVYNRLTEPFQMIRVLITGTEWDNFFWLRNDKAADPTIEELAKVMQQAMNNSKPVVLLAGQWHLPFVDTIWEVNELTQAVEQKFLVYDVEGESGIYRSRAITLEDAIKVSCARCAATSFRNENYGLEKCLSVYHRLVNGDKMHSGALEHCATPMKSAGYSATQGGSKYRSNHSFIPYTWEEGISHVDRNGELWSGNFKGFIQYRKTLKGENYVKP